MLSKLVWMSALTTVLTQTSHNHDHSLPYISGGQLMTPPTINIMDEKYYATVQHLLAKLTNIKGTQ